MKKLILTSVIAMAMSAGVAQANTGELQFIGSVSDVTCDIVVENEGIVTNVIQLGTTAPGNKATEVEFALKAKDPNACSLGNLANADVSWASNSINSIGLGNSGGTATNTNMTLSAKNSQTAPTAINKNVNTATFDSDKVVGDEGFQFVAQLDAATTPGATAGTYVSAAAFAVAYR